MQSTTRLKILDYLRKNQTSTAREISASLGMTGANIRRHLAILEATDLIVVVDRRKIGRGRPENVFSVSNQVLGNGLDVLAGAMMNAWWGSFDEDKREAALRSVAEKLAENNEMDPSPGIHRRLALTIDRLNSYHYRAHWVAGATGAKIIMGHCPYADIIARHPELCRLDAHLLEIQLALPVKQVAKLERGKDGSLRCIFTIE